MIKFESDINNMRLGVESSNNYDQEIDLLSENITKLEKDLKSRLLLIQKLKSDMQYKTDLIQKLHDIKQFWTGGGTHGGLRSLLNQVIDNQVLSPHTNAKARKFKGYVEKEIHELENDITTTEYDQQQMNSLWNAIDVLGTTLATESEHINRLQNTMKHKADLVQQFRDIQGRFTTNGALRFLQDYSGSEIRSQEQKKLTRQCQKVQR